MAQIIKSLSDLSSLNKDHFVVERTNGMITGASGLNVQGFWKMLKNNLQNLFVLQAFAHVGLALNGLDITVVDKEKSETFVKWLQEKRAYEATATQSTTAAYAGTAQARPVILSPEEENALLADWDTAVPEVKKSRKKEVVV